MGKTRSTTKNDKQPKHGRSHLIVTPDAGTPSGGDEQQHKVGRAIGKGRLPPGPGTSDKQHPGKQRNHKIERWCHGAKDYK